MSDGGLSGGVLIIRDTTERSLHRLQDQFLGLASHELRTPIQALQTAVQMLQQSLANGDNQRLTRRAAELALEQTQRMSRLVDDLLDAGRLQSGKYTFTQERLRFDELAQRVLETGRLLAEGKQITLSGANEPTYVMGDAQRLEQAILNLVNNAIKHASTSDRVEMILRREGHEAVLDVRDYGPGIAEADLPHLFTRFFQVSGSRSRENSRSGLGLGLYIAQQIVQAHGGRITVATQAGKGSTFSIHLPLNTNRSPKR